MKNLFFLGLFLSVFTFSHAQTELWLGPKAGINMANVSNLDGNSYMGAYGGVAFGIHFSERYALQPEMGFSMQGSTEIYNSNEDLQLTYFTLGVINKLYLVDGLHLLAGPEFNFKVNDTFSDWADSEIYDEDGNYIGDTDAQPFDMAIVGGLGYDLPFGLTLEARYKQGIQDVMNFINWDSDQDSRLNQVFQFGIAYKFHMNKK
ncbi:porin family protein [Moheibacter lacus]|uniref:PorT family protein n=1 Tax=Moheibacter lacus TaxID=2745851 RepID=A0A838ZNH1_9FLAO|nr:porin family protein [Moheibacter lacus]MBA5628787.1 PorT family protein [Moheibacter lacus]